MISMERAETKLTIQLDVRTAEITDSAVRMKIDALRDIMTRTLPEGGMDRMTSKRVEELLAVPALTAHL